jgi:hypothetical protein
VTRPSLSDIRRALYARASAQHDELALAAHALLGAPPTAEQTSELLDFFCLEWVDAEGWTVTQRAAAEGAVPAEVDRWALDAHRALFVVDGWSSGNVQLRDIATEDAFAVHAPWAEADLPRRSVLRATIVPFDGTLRFFGEPDVWDPMGVIARMELLAEWQRGPEPDLLARLRALRAAFVRQREERDVWVSHFGADLVVFEGADDMERRLARFISVLFNEARFPSLGGRTRHEVERAHKGDEPKVVQFALGPTLRGSGRHGAIYDAVEGIHFLPALGEFLDHLGGRGDHADVVRTYLDDPGITFLPFRRAAEAYDGASARVAALLAGAGPARMEDLIVGIKGNARRAEPSVLPGFDD